MERSCDQESARMRGIVVAVLGLLLFVGVLLPISPAIQKVPWRDSGTYLYMGRLIVAGGVPYRDGWDQKPPGVYLINALGLWLGHGSWWGVWGLELVSLLVATMLSFHLLERTFGTSPALFASAAWLISLGMVLEGGNLTEEYALADQFGILVLFAVSESRHRYGWRGVAIGALTAALFCLRQNLIGAGLSVMVYLVLTRLASRRFRHLTAALVSILIGVIAGLAVLGVYLAIHGVLADFWDQVFRYNLFYCDVSMMSRVKALFESLRMMAPSGIMLLTVASWLMSLWHLVSSGRWNERMQPLLGVFLIGVPMEFMLTSIAGNVFPHYLMAWLPMCSVGIGLFAYSMWNDRGGSRTRVDVKGSNVLIQHRAWLLALLFAMSILPAARTLSQLGLSRQPNASSHAVEYLKASTSDHDLVLVWGAEPSVNFLSRRWSPTRFFSQDALYNPRYHTPAMIEEFFSDLKLKKPSLILDASARNPRFPPLDPGERAHWAAQYPGLLLPDMERVFQYLASHYEVIRVIDAWPIYRYRGGE